MSEVATENAVEVPPNSQESAAQPSGEQQAQPPVEGSSNGEKAEAPKSALEAATRVMASEKAKGETAAPVQQKSQDGSPPPKDEDETVPSEVRNNAKFREMRSENRILKVAKEKNEAAIAELTPKASHYDNLSGWLRQQALDAEDFKQGLGIMAAMKNDPFEAYKMLKPIFEQLESMVGERLPADLQAKVDANLVDMDTAKALARERGQSKVFKERSERTAQQIEEDRRAREEEERDRQVQSIVEGVGAHVKAWESRDPDAKNIRDMVLDQVELQFRKIDAQRDSPWTLEEATKVVDEVIRSVKERMRKFMPAPQPKLGAMPVGGSSTGATPVPKSSLEAAQQALATGAR